MIIMERVACYNVRYIMNRYYTVIILLQSVQYGMSWVFRVCLLSRFASFDFFFSKLGLLIYHLSNSGILSVPPQLSLPPQNTEIFPSMCGIQFSLGSRIFNGEETEVGEFPWMVRLIRKYKNSDGRFNACNGFLITAKHVITAAHCIRNKELNSMGPL